MPRFDGTGPTGCGPLTGRGMGFCVKEVPKDQNLLPANGLVGNETALPGRLEETFKEVNPMPAGNGTGPLGFGPMTGRAAGYCAGYPVPGYLNRTPGRRFSAQSAYPGGFPSYGATGWRGYPPPYPAYGAPYSASWSRPFGRGFGGGQGFGRGHGFGRGRGRW